MTNDTILRTLNLKSKSFILPSNINQKNRKYIPLIFKRLRHVLTNFNFPSKYRELYILYIWGKVKSGPFSSKVLLFSSFSLFT